MAQESTPRLTDAYSSSGKLYRPPAGFAAAAHINALDRYRTQYRQSVESPEDFWAQQANERLHWFKPFDRVKNVSYASDNVSIKWFEDGQTNASYNCLDRHLDEHGDRTALIWEPDDPNASAKHISYRALHEQVCKLGNVLKSLGVKKGDRITIYMPMIPEAAVAMLACSRIGAVHSVVFAGFSPTALAESHSGLRFYICHYC